MIAEKKQLLRKALLEKRKALRNEKKINSDLLIAERFLSSDFYKRCKTLLVYCSTPIEVDTFYVIKSALRDGKRVAAPVCTDFGGRMDFYLFDDISQLVPSHFNILAPLPCDEKLVVDFTDALCVVPALSFDKSGNRLGYGKGYYDRFLTRTGVSSVGFCYENFLYEDLPVDCFDKTVDYLVCENSVIKF